MKSAESETTEPQYCAQRCGSVVIASADFGGLAPQHLHWQIAGLPLSVR